MASKNCNCPLFERCSNSYHPQPRSSIDDVIFIHLFERPPAPLKPVFYRFISNNKAFKDPGDQHALAVDKVGESSLEHLFKDSLVARDLSILVTYLKQKFVAIIINLQTAFRLRLPEYILNTKTLPSKKLLDLSGNHYL